MKYLAIEAVRILRAAKERISTPYWWQGATSHSEFSTGAAIERAIWQTVRHVWTGEYLAALLARVPVAERDTDLCKQPSVYARRNVLAVYDKAIAKLCAQWGIPLLLLLTLAAPARAGNFEPFTKDQINARFVQLYRERDTLERELAADTAALESKQQALREKQRDIADLTIREKALIDAGQRRAK